MGNLTLGQLYYLARQTVSHRNAAIAELDRRINREAADWQKEPMF
jgi:hypothetical protein